MLGSHCILFQAPTVVSKKVHIPPALEALFYNANVLVKALTQLFTQITITLWKKFDSRKCSFTDIRAPSWRKPFSSSTISFSYSVLWWFPILFFRLLKLFFHSIFSECPAEIFNRLSQVYCQYGTKGFRFLQCKKKWINLRKPIEWIGWNAVLTLLEAWWGYSIVWRRKKISVILSSTAS